MNSESHPDNPDLSKVMHKPSPKWSSCIVSFRPTLTSTNLVPGGPRRLVILLQTKQQFPEARLLATRRSTLGALAAQVNQLGNALPASSASSCVVAVGKELLSLFPCLGNLLVLLVVVVLVEVVDVLLCFLDCLLLALGGDLIAVLDLKVAALAPFADHIGLWRVGSLGCERGCRLAGEEGECGPCDCAARGHVLVLSV